MTDWQVGTVPTALGFIDNRLLRAGIETDPDGAAREAEGGLVVVIAGEQAILARRGEGATAFLPSPPAALGPVLDRLILGRLDGRPIMAQLHAAEGAAALADDPEHVALDLRSVAVQGAVPADEMGALAQAKAFFFWHGRHRFCGVCGSPTVSRCAGIRRDCTGCGAQHFPRTDPVTIMLVVRGDHCLLGRQARFVPNSYSCLAGFVSPGETIEAAVRRETLEESGIEVGRVTYLASQPWPFPASLMIGCLGEALTDAIVLDREELEDARWFSRDEVAAMLERRHPDGLITPPPMAIANHLMRLWTTGEARFA